MFANGNPIKRESLKEAVPFTDEEILRIWNSKDSVPFADMILIGIYSGWRPQELSILQIADIDLEAVTMKGGLKTDAGKNRIMPIHSIIKPLIENRMKKASTFQSGYLFNDENGQQGTYMTFITKAKACNMDEYILKLIVEHSIEDITEKVYTHRTMEQLRNEIEKITK